MNNKIKPLSILFFLLYSMQATADNTLNHLMKSQDDIDRSVRQENKVIKKDIYSNLESNVVIDSSFPIEKNCFQINELEFEDDFLNDISIRKLKDKVKGRCLGVLGIQKVATDLQDYFINKGYVTTRVEIPEQDISSNILHLKIAAGRIENIIIKDDDVNSWILPFKKNDILNIRDIEQGLEVLQKTPGVDVKINIEPGKQHSYSNVLIDTGRTSIWGARTWVNNWGDDATGKELVGTAGYLYNMTNMNDVFYLSAITNTKMDGGYKNFSAYYSIPIGYWEFDLFYSNSDTKQKSGDRSLNLKYIGKNQHFSLKATRIIYRDQTQKVAINAELIRRKVNYKLNDIELVYSKKDLTNIRLGLNYKKNFERSFVDMTFSYQRFLRWFGAEETYDMTLGDVSPISNILSMDMKYLHVFNLGKFNSYYDAQVGLQYSPNELTLQDQFTIGTRWSVRGFENSSSINGNKGFYIQNNINIMTGIQNIEWYAGLDYGQIWGLKDNGSYGSRQLMGIATGLRGGLAGLGYELYVSKPLIYPKELNVDQFNLSFNLSYRL